MASYCGSIRLCYLHGWNCNLQRCPNSHVDSILRGVFCRQSNCYRSGRFCRYLQQSDSWCGYCNVCHGCVCRPFASPFTGGFITMSYLGWRWTMYISCIMGFLSTVLCLLFLKETYAPAILVEKAIKLRRQTHNWGTRARQEEVELDWEELITNNFSRPLRMLSTEPIVFLVCPSRFLGAG